MQTTKRVLVVDDDADLLILMDQLLRLRGFAVDTLADGHQLMTVLQTQLPDLILLDINLNGCDGRELCLLIKTIEDYAHIPIILYSAGKYSADICEKYKASHFIAKPFDTEKLITTIRSLCAA
jgi:CheY-like chemotaxis protein